MPEFCRYRLLPSYVDNPSGRKRGKVKRHPALGPRHGPPELNPSSGQLQHNYLCSSRVDLGSCFQGALAGTLVVAVLGIIAVAIMLYYKFRRRLKRLKSELAHVHYIADPGTQPGKRVLVGYIYNKY